MMEIVYKFIPNERLSYLENELLRITQPADLNDPFEFLPAIPSIEDFIYVVKELYKEKDVQINKLKINKKQKKDFVNQNLREYKTQIRKLKNKEKGNVKDFFINRAVNNINTNLGVLSMTRRWDSALMWSHYTNSHKGICIGFGAQNPFFSNI
jgi:hypothetical protein